MRIGRFLLLSLLLGHLGFVSCSQTVSKVWLFEWKLLNDTDSATIIGDFTYKVNVDHVENAATITEDTLLDSGVLIFQIITVGDKQYVDEFPNSARLNIELNLNNNTLKDTIFSISEMKFCEGYSILYKQSMQNINYDTLYISNLGN